MTTPDLTPARLRELLDAATPGNWVHHSRGSPDGPAMWITTDAGGDGPYLVAECEDETDARLLALAPALAQRVIELEAALSEARSMLSMVRVTKGEWDADGERIDGDLEKSWSAALAPIDAALRARTALEDRT